MEERTRLNNKIDSLYDDIGKQRDLIRELRAEKRLAPSHARAAVERVYRERMYEAQTAKRLRQGGDRLITCVKK